MGRRIDLIGQTFGKWTVLSRAPSRGGASYWSCRCECGVVKCIYGGNLRRLKSTACRRCSATKRRHAPGETVGRWTLLSQAPNRGRNPYWNCRCACGTEAAVASAALHRSGTPMCRRCKNSRPGTARRDRVRSYTYGAAKRGLTWDLSNAALDRLFGGACYWCGDPPGHTTTSCAGEVFLSNGIDRMNSSRGYAPDNCVSCCTTDNRMKMDLSADEYARHILKVAAHLRFRPIREALAELLAARQVTVK